MPITLTELSELLATKRGCQFITMTCRTVPAMNKRGNPLFGRLEKLATVNGAINWNYTNAVNNRRRREGVTPNFTAEPRVWGVRLPGLPFVEYKGKLYLELKVERSVEYVYLVDGKITPKEKVTPYLIQSTGNPRQDLIKEVMLRDYALETIEQIKVGGRVYDVKGSVNLQALRDIGVIKNA